MFSLDREENRKGKKQMCLFKECYLSVLVSASAELITVKPLHNGHLGERRKWQLWVVIRPNFI